MEKKLFLNKVTVSNLNTSQLNQVLGGITSTDETVKDESCTCDTTGGGQDPPRTDARTCTCPTRDGGYTCGCPSGNPKCGTLPSQCDC